MSKVDHILVNSGRTPRSMLTRGLKGNRPRILLVTLIALLTAFIFFTQPEVSRATQSLIGSLPGF